jgi:hypothetical protein
MAGYPTTTIGQPAKPQAGPSLAETHGNARMLGGPLADP